MQKLKTDYSFIQSCLENNRIFVAFSKPGETYFTLMIQKEPEVSTISDFRELKHKKGFVFAPFDIDSLHKIYVIDNHYTFSENEVIPDNLYNTLKTYKSGIKYPGKPYFCSRNEYMDQFNIFHKNLKRHTMHKVVLSRIIPYELFPGFEVSGLFKEINAAYPDAFNYVINIPETGTWIGATPEEFLKIDGESASTVSLAGTQKDQGRLLSEVLWNTKEVSEQQYVTDYIKTVLEHFVHCDRLKMEKQTVKAGNMLHLKTQFSFPSAMIKKNPGKFIDMLHPTPAVCGLPKFKALDLIRETEIHDREYYSGFLGPVDIENSTDLYVNLRCLKTNSDQLSLYSGGGITIDSKPGSEWEETILKANTLTSVLDNLKMDHYGESSIRK